MYEVEGFYYLCSEKKDADQLRGYREADLRLCFRICKKLVFSRRGSYVIIDSRSLRVSTCIHIGTFSPLFCNSEIKVARSD